MTPIFHITHVDNLPGMCQDGILCDRRGRERDASAVNIGHEDLKRRRAQYPVPCGPRGVLADYTPFYFAPRSPMLYAIHKRAVRGVRARQSEIVHVVSSCEAVAEAGLPFVFTNGHAIVRLSDYFTDLGRLDQIDWDIMKATYWKDGDGTGESKRRRQAEFLVHRGVPWSLVTTIGVMTEAAAERARQAVHGSPRPPSVVVRPHWYY